MPEPHPDPDPDEDTEGEAATGPTSRRDPAEVAADPSNPTRPTGERQAAENREDDPPA
ncbi:hypothetical protein [Dermatobacter hominis]|uniref:hypothetical protein n=1 Tax=Dermatobacter hominis TaxID=2884263 RepID=UPI001D104A43|nr:hypothetical protein [Dermatobacter hominis]UDY34990.1 hypothetical protein LH044_16830 [Dermatobacter hominis]